MKFAAAMIDDRPQDEAVKAHMNFLPSSWEIMQFNKYPIASAGDYNNVLTSKEFWNKLIEYDRVLIFQHDSGLLRRGIEEFLEWDYVGAPWKFQAIGGNGGLSLRNPKAMLKVIEHQPYGKALGNEDVYFSNMLELFRLNLAPREVCSRFSCECIFELGALGYHCIERYFTPDQVTQIKTQYAKT